MKKPVPLLIVLTLAALGGCAGGVPTAPVAGPDPATVTAQSSATPAPSPVWSVPPPVQPGTRPAASSAPAGATPAAGGITVVGVVYGDHGLPLYGAGVSIQSLDPKRPYSDRVIAPKGAYTFTGVPAGINVKVAANLRFYDPRSIMATTPMAPGAEPLRVNFEGALALPKQ